MPPHLARSLADLLVQFEGIRLFVERAQAIQPGFALTEQNALFVSQICARLDGIPLAIELAATRVQILSVEDIAARLDDRFNLLTLGSRTASPRHQTLQAVLDWSYDLLSEAERMLFRRLSVFVGGFTLKAAESITDFGFTTLCPLGISDFGLEPEQIVNRKYPYPKYGHKKGTMSEIVNVLDLLTHLVNKSLIVVERRLGDVARYRLLETIRQYADEKLTESDEEELVRNRHLAFFLKLAEQAEPELKGGRQIAWFTWLAEEHDNLRAALTWVLAQNNVETALRLTGALFEFWLM